MSKTDPFESMKDILPGMAERYAKREAFIDSIVPAMTDPNKAAVLAKWPDAECKEHYYAGHFWFRIETPDRLLSNNLIGTEPEAWADAARRLG